MWQKQHFRNPVEDIVHESFLCIHVRIWNCAYIPIDIILEEVYIWSGLGDKLNSLNVNAGERDCVVMNCYTKTPRCLEDKLCLSLTPNTKGERSFRKEYICITRRDKLSGNQRSPSLSPSLSLSRTTSSSSVKFSWLWYFYCVGFSS